MRDELYLHDHGDAARRLALRPRVAEMRQCRYCGETRFGTELCCPACGEVYPDDDDPDDDLDEEVDGLPDELDED